MTRATPGPAGTHAADDTRAPAGTPTPDDSPVPDRPLVLVDVQNCFSDGFSPPELPVAGVTGIDWGALTDRWLAASMPVVATKDWHVDPGGHFAAAGHEPDFETSWPRHGVAGTPGADFVPAVAARAGRFAAVFHKGQRGPGYSGFDGHREPDGTGGGLEQWLRSRGANRIAVAGIATSYCVLATVLDAIRLGFEVDVLAAYCVGVTPAAHRAALAEMRAAGATVRTGTVDLPAARPATCEESP